ncbi:HNH endonuclease [Cognatiluteimonas weifangensis]|uniref:HNH endonuclease n=1 Tax=Cognatiluteimonas weifangensis TaxID=2303539 RepID=A0A372DS29_9GAMM|nr:HNH endonuclease [Luteimonas weifangensis]RFP62343.1 HNH endonuclease [Luteimonas weifangensis]
METDRAIGPVDPGTYANGSPADPGADSAAVAVADAAAPPIRLDAVRLLSLDAHGRVLDWMSWQDAACLYVRGAVAWTLGDPCLQVHGGTSRATGTQSVLQLHPIIAARSHARAQALDPTPALTNAALFARDQQLCLYCGREYSRQQLTRDHVLPLSQGGRDIWENVVAACFHCNSRKGGRTPQQASMPLLAVPYRPSWIEHLILSNRNILADQMAFLRSHLPRRSRRFN